MTRIAKDLDGKFNIPAVAKQLELIQEIQTALWWQNVTLPMLEDVRLILRNLIRFIDPDQAKEDVYTNFKDDLGEAEAEYQIIKGDKNLKDYKDRVRRFIGSTPIILRFED